MPDYKRGEIYYVSPSYAETGSEIWSGRPAVIVSNDELNRCRNCVEVVYLTTRPKQDSPSHVILHATGRQSTAMCEQISTVDKVRMTYSGDTPCACTKKELSEIDAALLYSLSLDAPAPVTTLDLDKTRLLAERDIYKRMYEDLLERFTGIVSVGA